MTPEHCRIRDLVMRLYCLFLDNPDAIAVLSPVVQSQIALFCSDAGAVFECSTTRLDVRTERNRETRQLTLD